MKDRVLDWLKARWTKENKSLLCKAGLMALLPLLCCVITCTVDGGSIGQVYLPLSEWNDELFYFKQVEGILSHGYPQGYFGFNESHALKLSFAAWSPVLVWPWVLYGLIFGWNLMTPIYSNILFLTLTIVIFVLLVKPDWKQLGLLSILFCVFAPFVRYMLCGMPEIICFSMLIVYVALLISYLDKPGNGRLVLMFILAGLMTLMRPYLILFLLMPSWLWIRRKRAVGIVGSLGILGAVGGVYLAVNHYLGAAYFTPLFKTGWLEPFLQGHLLKGIRGILATLYYEGRTFFAIMRQGLASGLAEGAFFAGFLAMLVILLWQTVSDLRHKRKNKALLHGYLAFCFISMWAALLLMYKMKEGSKHLLTFMAAGLFVIALMETRYFKKAMLLGALCVYLFWVKGDQPYDYAIPYQTQEQADRLVYWEDVFESRLTLSEEEVPNYDNVVIWTFNDLVGEDMVLTDWQILYALPEGWGISCCYNEYVLEHLEELQSLYLLIPDGGRIQGACEEAGMERIGGDGRACVYRTR
ncbi:MAG: hypothetical protein NC543_05005 [bacterium]|nr:hypothetical protein [bacterium]MCM1374898.1 hypothetical protein [Muribaculum sp.]